MIENKTLIEQIIEIELEMFLTVPSEQKSSCQNYPDSFRLHRRALFSTWSKDTLRSHLENLENARNDGVNLMTIKYARMDDRIPRKNTNPLIEKITSIQYKWQEEVFQKYPNLMANARPLSEENDSAFGISFKTYLISELETYSDETLALLYRDMAQKLKNETNMSEELYGYLVKEMGYDSIEAADQAVKRDR